MATVLQQTLSSLCFQTGWCYAVLWKLKRRSRMVLTWEDGYYEYSRSPTVTNRFSAPRASNSRLLHISSGFESGGNPLDQGAFGFEASCPEGQIGLAVAKMSYYVYSMGEGIIGRVAFTGKHQWVFGAGESNCMEVAPGGVLNNQCMLEKYPDGWQNQFAAGIKTIAVIAVPQGVVQLGSTERMMENLEWVDHVKSVFGTLQTLPGAFLSDLHSKGQGCKSALNTLEMSAINSSAAVGRPTSGYGGQQLSINFNSTNVTAQQVHTYGSQGRPSLLKGLSTMHGQLPKVEATEAAIGMLEESELPHGIKLGTEAQGSIKLDSQKYRSTVPQVNMSSIVNQKIPMPSDGIVKQKISMPSDGLGNCSLRDVDENELRKNFQLSKTHLKGYHQQSPLVFVTGYGSEAKIDLSAGLQNGIHPEVSCNQEHLSVKRMLLMDNMSDINRNEISVGAPLVNGAGEQQLNATPSKALTPLAGHNASGTQNPSPSSTVGTVISSMVKYRNLLNLPPAKHDMSSQECSKDFTQTTPASWSICGNHFNSNMVDSDGVAAAVQNSLYSITDCDVLEGEGLIKSTSSCVSESTVSDLEIIGFGSKGQEPIFRSIGYNSLDDSSLDNFDKYLPSSSRGQSGKWGCSFAIGDELSQALGPAFRKGHDKEFWEEILLHSGGVQNNEDPNQQTVKGYGLCEQSKAEVVQEWGSSSVKEEHNGSAFGSQLSESKSEPLLNAVVDNSSSHVCASTNVDDSFSCKTTFSGLDNGIPVPYNITESDPKHAACSGSRDCLSKAYMQGVPDCEGTVDIHSVNQVSDARRHLNLHMSSDASLKGMLSAWTEEGQSIKSDTTQHSQPKKPEELAKASRKRARPGESTRPRPKDRQQIQDRVRELREIVPDGSKCSIDALLEKTIKHMLFLQNVSQNADKLKKNDEFKVPSSDSNSVTQDDMESGASWAFEVGGQEPVCPILVKDLNQPRQMLVEMFCGERGHFLEIADIIRNLGLTILKGVMESRTDKIWAWFVVEANRDIHRVQVLLSLMRQLHLDNNSSSSITTASQSGPIWPEQGIGSNISQTICGFQESSFAA